MRSGKLDEELSRMSRIIDQISPGSLLLCNESFASTNEREGAKIARQIIRALLDRGVKVLYVTHLFDLADGFYQQHMARALFLRAERQADGQRTFRLVPGEPLPTSYGLDLYQRISAPNGWMSAHHQDEAGMAAPYSAAWSGNQGPLYWLPPGRHRQWAGGPSLGGSH